MKFKTAFPYIICVALLGVGTFFDLAVASACYSPGSILGKLAEALGELPAAIPVLLLGAYLLCTALKTTIFCEETSKLLRFALYAALCVALCALTVNLLKLGWGRLRYAELLAEGDTEGFTRWYLPRGFGLDGRSFPSGHAAMSAMLLLLPRFLVFCGRPGKLVIRLLAWGFIICVCFGRILEGAHFLSDVSAGVLISLGVQDALSPLLRLTLKPKSLQEP